MLGLGGRKMGLGSTYRSVPELIKQHDASGSATTSQRDALESHHFSGSYI